MTRTEEAPKFRVSPEELVCLCGRLQAELGHRGRAIRLEAHGEGLTLRGRAQSYYVKQLAQEAVAKICSYKLVANEIEVRYEKFERDSETPPED